MKIYQYKNNAWVNEPIEVMPSNAPTFDETLETLSFALISNTDAEPYDPMSKFKLEDDSGNTSIFVLTSDSVSLFSLNPLRYKHNIVCSQNTRELSKHIVRNSVFSQPAQMTKKSFFSILMEARNMTPELYRDYYSNCEPFPIILTPNEKVSKAFVKINVFFANTDLDNNVYNNANTDCKLVKLSCDNTFDDINDSITTGKIYFDDTKVKYQISNNPNAGRTPTGDITPSDIGGQWLFNTPIECPMLADAINTARANNTTDKLYVNMTSTIDANFDWEMPITQESMTIPQTATDVRPVVLVIQYEIILETYYYSAYDILNLLIERQKQETYNYTKQPLFSLPTRSQNAELYDLLTNTIAPNFTFTQLTMFECVAEVFRLFDATFTLDENNVLGIEYLNDNNGTEIEPVLTAQNMSIGEDRYTNKLVSYYQDARKICDFPRAKNEFGKLSSEGVGIIGDGDENLKVDFPIDELIELKTETNVTKIERPDMNPTYEITIHGYLPVDLSYYVVNEQLWSLLDTSNGYPDDPRDLRQYTTIYYEKGTRLIRMGLYNRSEYKYETRTIEQCIKEALVRFFGIIVDRSGDHSSFIGGNLVVDYTRPTDWLDLNFHATYYASLDGRVQTESINNKYDGETIVDQVNGAVDLNKMGLNMFGMSLKLGEPTLSATHTISAWEDRIKVGDIYTYNNEKWIANVVNYIVLANGVVQGQVSFVKNYNALSLRTRILREKRMSNISSALTVKSEDNYSEFLYFSANDDLLDETKQDLALKDATLYKGLYQSFINDDAYNFLFGKASFYNLKCYYDQGTWDTTETPRKAAIPLTTYGFGNSVCFEFTFDQPMSAGNKTEKTQGGWWIFSTVKYFSRPVYYADENGFAEEVYRLGIANATSDDGFVDIYDLNDNNYPELSDLSNTLPDSNYAFELGEYKVYKQPNEIFALNYQLSFLPFDQDNDFVGSAFIDKCFFATNENRKDDLYIYMSMSNRKYSVLDTEGIADSSGTIKKITGVSVGNDNGKLTLTFTHEIFGNIPKSWAICDSRGKILFATNTSNGNYTEKVLYFLPRHDRLD